MARILLVMLCAMLFGGVWAPAARTANVDAVVEGNNAFALELFTRS